MPKPKMTQELACKLARDEFRKEVKHRRVDLDISQKDLGDHLGVSAPLISKLLADPDKLTVDRLRRIVYTLNLDPGTVLRLLGFDTKKLNIPDSGAVIPITRASGRF